MPGGKTVREVMVSISSYPQVPYWFEVGQAIKIVKVTCLDTNKCYMPMTMLVLDEKYDLLGTLTLKEILGRIEEEQGSRAILEMPVGKIISPAKFFLQADDPAAKAASLMIENKLDLLPVSDGKKRFIGLVRMMEIFDELMNVIFSDYKRRIYEGKRFDDAASGAPEAREYS